MVSKQLTDESDVDNTHHVLVLLGFSDHCLLPLASPIDFDRNTVGMCNICPLRVEQKVVLMEPPPHLMMMTEPLR
jgi:hypothetical protein